MRKSFLAALALSCAALAGAALADGHASPAERAVQARQAYYTLLGAQMGPLAAMAKGEAPYDAEAAARHAAALALMMDYPAGAHFAPGTSSADMAGKTRALPAIWTEMEDYRARGGAMKTAVAGLVPVAADGRGALGKAVGAVGAACKACHDAYRAKDF